MKKMEELNVKMTSAKTAINTIEAKLINISDALDVVKATASKHTEEIRAINFSLDELEQYGRRKNLRFLGVPEAATENTDNLILDNY